MVVAMRLMRMGTTHRPVYRISVADSRRVPRGKFLEHIGSYDPNPDKHGNKMLRLNVARAKYWIAMGCQPSGVVSRLLSRFHLLPVPPQRSTVVTGPLLHRVLAGEDVRPYVPQPGEHPALTLTKPVAHVQKTSRHAAELSDKRIAQLKEQAPWKLQTFPFDPSPNENTMAAWQQVRAFHKHLPIVNVTQQAILDAANWSESAEERLLFGEADDAAQQREQDELDAEAAEDAEQMVDAEAEDALDTEQRRELDEDEADLELDADEELEADEEVPLDEEYAEKEEMEMMDMEEDLPIEAEELFDRRA